MALAQVEPGLFDEARVAELALGPENRVEVLSRLGVAAGDAEALFDALRVASDIDDKIMRGIALGDIAIGFAEGGLSVEASGLLRRLEPG